MFGTRQLPPAQVVAIAPRLLAHLGDAVFHLYEREREIESAISVKAMHLKMVDRACAVNQAQLLDQISPHLSPAEADVVRRARNVKAVGKRKSGQTAYRKSTAFEALIGYLYLVDRSRMTEILDLCAPAPLSSPESTPETES